MAEAVLAASLAGLSGEVRDEISRLTRLGYRGVVLDAARPDLRPRALDGAARRAALATFRRLDVRLVGIDLWIPPGDLLDEVRCTRAIDAISATIELAADLGRVAINLLLPEGARSASATAAPRADGTGTASAPEELRRFIEPGPRGAATAPTSGLEPLLAELLRRAERFGVDLVDHALPAPATARGAESPRLRIGVDPAAYLSRGIDPVDAVIAAASRLGGARVCDLTRSGMRAPIADARCGGDFRDARLDPAAYAAALSASTVTVPVVDCRRWSDPWSGLERSIEVWHRATS